MRCAIKILKYTHENGCQWYEGVCSIAAQYGHLECLRNVHEMVALGMELRVTMQLNMDIWIAYAMHMRMAVLGMKLRVNLQL